jgi:hypothetical protein
VLPEIVATLVFELVNVSAPELFVVTEEVRLNDGSIVNLSKLDKDKDGSTLFTVSVAVVVADLYIADSAKETVIVVVPAPTIVAVLPEIVATLVFELVNVSAPELFVVTEEVRLNDGSIVNLSKLSKNKEGIALTVSVAVVVAGRYTLSGDSAKETFIVAVPAPTIVTVLPDIVATDGFELVNVSAPEPSFVTKGVRLNDGSKTDFVKAAKDKLGTIGLGT